MSGSAKLVGEKSFVIYYFQSVWLTRWNLIIACEINFSTLSELKNNQTTIIKFKTPDMFKMLKSVEHVEKCRTFIRDKCT